MTAHGMTPYFTMLCACAWFSAMGLLTHALNERGWHWLVVAVTRSGLAAIFACLMAIGLGIQLVYFRPRMLWLRSFAGSFSMLCTFYAFAKLNVSDVLTLTNTFPVWIAFLSWPLAGEKPTPGVWLAVVFSVLGIAIAMDPTGAEFKLVPSVAALAAAFFTAVAMLGLNRLKGVNSLAVVVHFSTVSTLVCAAVLLVQVQTGEASVELKDEKPLEYVMLLAVGFTAVFGQVFLTRAYATGSPTKVSVVGLSQVLMVMAVEVVLGMKEVSWNTIVGTALVLGPVAWLMSRERRPPKAANEIELEEVAIE